jgi:hypothetical protein
LSWVACELGKVGDPENQENLGEALVSVMTGYVELDDGYSFSLGADRLVQVSQWMANERLCCSFFQFDLSLKPGAHELSLALTGGEGVKEFIASEMVSRMEL